MTKTIKWIPDGFKLTPLYLSKTRLKGYKTLKDSSAQFMEGLNIIIGKNGAGKTNFLTILSKALNFDLDKEVFADIHFELGGRNNIKVDAKRNIETKKGKDTSYTRDEVNYSVSIDGQSKIVNNNYPLFPYFNDYPIQTQFIKHGIPVDYPIFQRPFSYSIDLQTSDSDDLWKELTSGGAYFKNCLLKSLYHLDLKKEKRTNKNLILDRLAKNLLDIRVFLSSYTEIKDIRFRDSVSIYSNNEKVHVSDIQLEFFVNSNWMLFDQLSDGTKRSLFIISEIGINSDGIFGIGYFGSASNFRRIILLEEPELSIHPHLLSNLMDFIREQSKTKQIIITTHSPQVLDMLNKDELDRIIIASYDTEKGTQMRHLSKAEQQKAKTYIENEAFLSDYWKHSDLEK